MNPMPGHHANGNILSAHTAIHIVLSQAIDSGSLKNGQVVHGRLVRLSSAQEESSHRSGRQPAVPVGSPVILTVVSTAPAGKLSAVGEFSLQLVRLGGHPVDTEILTFRGKPGHRDLPDSAPALGTNAGLRAGAALTFHIQPPPAFAENAPGGAKHAPGSVTGVAAGSPADQRSSQHGSVAGSPSPTGKIPSGNAPRVQTPASNIPGPAQNAGQVSVAPNQPAAPANTKPVTSSQPR